MAIEHFSTGPVLVVFNSVNLGYTRDGAQVTIEEFTFDVKSDDWGGQDGAPADQQMLGFRALIQLELTKFERSALEALTSFQPGGTIGTYPVFGSFKRQDSKSANLVLDGVSRDYTFATALINRSQEVNFGTKHSTWRCNFEAWANAPSTRVLFTAS